MRLTDRPGAPGVGVPRVSELDLTSLPVCRVARLVLDLVHDGLGFPLGVPIMVAKGARPGPVLGITAALHGNELNGIPVIHRLFEQLDCRVLRGTVVAVVAVNVPGFLMGQREFSDGHDLNHIMPGKPDGNDADVYAYRFLNRVVRTFDFLVDMHTASFGRVNCLYVRADMTDATTARMAYLQRPQIILHHHPSDRTLRGAASEWGVPSITVEIGNPHRFQYEYIRRSVSGVRAVMGEIGMLPKRKLALGAAPVVCERSQWLYTDHGGLLEVFPAVTEPVAKGQLVARQTTIYGDVIREYRAPAAGVVIGKSVNPVGQTGARILHLGVVAAPERLSYWEQADAAVAVGVPDGGGAGGEPDDGEHAS